MYYKCMYIFLHIFKIFTDYLKQFEHFVCFLCFYILFDFFLLAPTRFGLHRLARSQANPQTERSNFVVADSDTKQVSQTIVLWLSLSLSVISLSIFGAGKFVLFFPNR